MFFLREGQGMVVRSECKGLAEFVSGGETFNFDQ